LPRRSTHKQSFATVSTLDLYTQQDNDEAQTKLGQLLTVASSTLR